MITEEEYKKAIEVINQYKEQILSEVNNAVIFKIPIINLNFGKRTLNCLKSIDIIYLNELCNMTISDILKIRNLGDSSMHEIVYEMKKYGLSFKEDIQTPSCFLKRLNQFK